MLKAGRHPGQTASVKRSSRNVWKSLLQVLRVGLADRADELLAETRRMSAEASGFGQFPAEALHREPQAIAEMLIEASWKVRMSHESRANCTDCKT
jgi:hypothetical protein